jgi:hypothetical protein
MRTSSQDRPRWPRRLLRLVLVLMALALLVVLAAPTVIERLGGHTRRLALEAPGGLSPAARAFVRELLAPFGDAPLVDVHAHLAGQGNGSGCWVNPRLRSLRHPADWVRFEIYRSAGGIDDPDAPDRAWVEHLAALARALPQPSRHYLLAFDHHYGADGEQDLEHTEFYVPNEWAAEAAAAAPERFRGAISVHPYRADASRELERWAARGARLVKWLPNAQGIDPLDPRCAPFYATMKRLDLVLLSHGGDEAAVGAGAGQALGNPLRLRAALDAGVCVIVAHCGSSGRGADLDAPGAPPVANVELFLRLMDDPRYDGLVFGEISTCTQVNRFRAALPLLLARTDLHARLVNGSDWPLPAVNVLYQTGALEEAGFLAPGERELLNELYHFHPLLFDVALKRAVRDPASGARFAPSVFLEHPTLRL